MLIKLNDLIAKTNPAFEKLKDYVFTYEQWKTVLEHSVQKGLALVIMPLDEDSFQLINEFKSHIRYIELHSVSYNDVEVKERIKKSGIDLILGAGGRTKQEIDEALLYFGHQLKVLMTGFQSYPSAIQDIRLRKISDLIEMYPQLMVGYGDHSSYNDPWNIRSNDIAYALGATVFEKHLTLDEGKQRVDYESAISVEKFRVIKQHLDELNQVLHAYDDALEMTAAEQNYRNRQKMVVARRDLPAGTVLLPSDLSLKMVGRFDGFSTIDSVIGKRLQTSILADTIIKSDDVSS
jgi:N,N'-diacetyllegionaminate synthase